VEESADGDTYRFACRDEVSFRELDDLRQRGFLNDDLTLSERGRDERQRMLAGVHLSHDRAAVALLALETSKEKLDSAGVGRLANETYLDVALQLRTHMRSSEESTKRILALMEAPEPRPVTPEP
jgi:hypothetical protein